MLFGNTQRITVTSAHYLQGEHGLFLQFLAGSLSCNREVNSAGVPIQWKQAILSQGLSPGAGSSSKGGLDCRPTPKAPTSALTHLSGSLDTSEAPVEGDESSMAPGISFKKPLKAL